jgi:hypothetical protein
MSPSMSPSAVSEVDDYFFDLRGYLVREQVLSNEQLQALNAAVDRFPALAKGEWMGNAQRRDYTTDTGFELHNFLIAATQRLTC